jgi:hypothetical protein
MTRPRFLHTKSPSKPALDLEGVLARSAAAAAVGSLPKRTLVAVSQAEAALTTKVFLASAIIFRVFRVRAESSESHQSNGCVSSNARNCTAPSELARSRNSEQAGVPHLLYPQGAPVAQVDRANASGACPLISQPLLLDSQRAIIGSLGQLNLVWQPPF